MLIKRDLILGSEQRKKQEKLEPAKLDNQLGDGPMTMTVEQKQTRMRQLIATTENTEIARAAFERIINGNDLDSVNYLLKGVAAARPICRLQLKDLSNNLIGYATGFLIGPGLLMTNNHVFGNASEAKNSIADFNYELDISGMERQPVRFRLAPGKLFYTNRQLDYSLVAVEAASIDGGKNLSDWGWHQLSGTSGKGDLGEYLTIIQHPGGEMKQVCVRENKLLKYDTNTVWYATDTMGGSSGSPVFNRFWQVMALHHSGVPKKNAQGQWLTKDGKVWDESMDESLVDWLANEGMRISVIVNDMKLALGGNPLVKTALESAPPSTESTATLKTKVEKQPMPAGVWVEQTGDTASLVVPMRIPIELVRRDVTLAPVPAQPAAAIGSTGPAFNMGSNGLPLEGVHINTDTYPTRPGYKPDFLGKGDLVVPLPVVPASLKSKVAPLIGKPTQSELKYFNYSVVMNKERKLAFFSAVNIDGGQQQDVGKREGDSWIRDKRLDPKSQIGDEFYGKQALFEADRSANPFDRGHLVRRLDATWGSTVEEAKAHGDDSFHFTNCSPQFFAFNQGKQLWAGLEDYTRNVLLSNSSKGIVMNGPIFDGPDAPEGQLPRASGASKKDLIFGGVPIPKYFWKVLITVKSGKLVAAAFVMSQKDQVEKIDRIHEADRFEALTQAQVQVFQVSMADLSRFSKLDFGNLAKADAHEATSVGPRLIESLDNIRLI